MHIFFSIHWISAWLGDLVSKPSFRVIRFASQEAVATKAFACWAKFLVACPKYGATSNCCGPEEVSAKRYVAATRSRWVLQLTPLLARAEEYLLPYNSSAWPETAAGGFVGKGIGRSHQSVTLSGRNVTNVPRASTSNKCCRQYDIVGAHLNGVSVGLC